MNLFGDARGPLVRGAIPSGLFVLSATLLLGTWSCRPPSETIETDASSNGSGGAKSSGSGGSGSSSGGGNGNGSGGSNSGGSNGNGSGGASNSGGSTGSGGADGSGGGTSASGGATGSGGGSGGQGAGGQAAGSGGRGGAAAGSGGRGGNNGGTATGGALGSGGAMGSGGDTASSCLDGLMNGTETGVDCGGSCPACVAYKTGAPNTDGNTKNACEANGTGFICPRFMLFSPEMKQAAADDAKDNNWPAGSFNYGVVTLNGAKCCECFQIVYSAPQNGQVSATPPKPLIAQNFNQGGANNAFDLFLGKGGEGAQTAGCSKMYSTYPGTGEPNGGGIRATTTSGCTGMGSPLSSQACVTAVTDQCEMIKSSSSYVQSTTQTSCIEGNLAQSLYHENWNVKAQRVECPTHLTEVTGCRLNGQGLPKPDPAIQTASQASSWSAYSTTTMQDCCKPSCAWPTNVSNTQGTWSAMYQCRMDGTPMTK